MTLPLVIAPNDPGHIDDHQELHTLLGRLDGQSTFLAAGSTTGALGSRPAASASNLGNFYFAASVPSLAFSDGAVWRELVTAAGSNTFTGINNFDDDIFFGSGKPWVDVQNVQYGATGDGVADDTSAITLAKSAAASLAVTLGAAVTVYFPAGQYKINGTVNGTRADGIGVADNLTFRGEGKYASKLVTGASLPQMIFFDGGSATIDNLTFEHLGFICNNNLFEWASTTSTALWIYAATNLTVRNCYFEGWTMAALHTATSGTNTNITFEDNHVYGGSSKTTNLGVSFTVADGVFVRRNRFHKVCRSFTGELGNNSSSRLYFVNNEVRTGRLASIDDPTFVGSGDGSNSYSAVNLTCSATGAIDTVVISGNTFTGPNAANTGGTPGVANDILIQGGSAATLRASNIVITGNMHADFTPRTSSDLPLQLYYCQSGTVVGNAYVTPQGAMVSPVVLNDSKGFVVGPNTVEGANWSASVTEIATIVLANLYICSTASNKAPSIPNLTTSQSFAYRYANNTMRLHGASIQFGPNGSDVSIDSNGQLLTSATTTTRASVRLPHGTAPSSPVNGDMWTTTAGLFVRINGATVGPLS